MSSSARREQLLDVTTELVGHQGFQNVTIELVSRSAGITRPIVYEHFGDLQGLLDAVVEREMARALSQVSETALTELTEGPPVELMIESLSSYLHTVQTHPTTWRLVLMPSEGAPEILRERIAQGRAAVLAQLIGAVRPALATEGEPPDAELTARLLSAISDEYARLLLADPARFPPERLLRHARWVLERAVSAEGRLA
ncbi:MAG: TetR/AcrR family transcriptional regulator [Actinomycetota bacterium]|nr:TetR/AcrR family transcriptional regulator [Actinomycetota bacterium]